MPETPIFTFSHKEIAEILVKHQGIHDGLWGIYIEFGLSGANVGPTPEEANPAAIVPVVKIGIQRYAAASNITVNAAEVNPDRA